jgi:hypothetical protein
MNTIEDRIRAAAHAAAGTVPPDGVPPLRLPPLRLAPEQGARRSRPGWSGWARRLTPLAAAVAVVAVVLAAVTVGRSVHGNSAPGAMTAGPPISSYLASGQVPPYYVSITSRGKPHSQPSYAVVRSTATGALAATIPPSTARTVFAVSPAADDRTFVLDEQLWPQAKKDVDAPHAFFLMQLNSAGHVDGLSRIAITVASGDLVSGLALSPDGSKLAIAVGSGQHTTTVKVDTLATGTVRTWYGDGAISYNYGTLGAGGNEAESLSWAADQRTLAFDWLGTMSTPTQDQGVWLLNLTRPGSDLLAGSRQAMSGGYPAQSLNQALGVAGDPLSCQGFSMLTPDGSTVICSTVAELSTRTVRIGNGTLASAALAARTGFVEYAAATGKISRVIGNWTIGRADNLAVGALWSNPSGSVLIGAIPVAGSIQIGVIRGNEFTPLPGQSALASAESDAW